MMATVSKVELALFYVLATPQFFRLVLSKRVLHSVQMKPNVTLYMAMRDLVPFK